MTYGDKPFGLSDVKLTNNAGTTQVDLPVAQRLMFKPRVVSGELSGDDALQSVHAKEIGIEWELEAGGISLTAYALLTGRTATVAGSTPNETTTLTGETPTTYPYIKIYGKSLGEGDDDVHCKIFKAKLTEAMEGEFKDGEFFISKCKGIGVDDGVNGCYEFVQNETAATLPSS